MTHDLRFLVPVRAPLRAHLRRFPTFDRRLLVPALNDTDLLVLEPSVRSVFTEDLQQQTAEKGDRPGGGVPANGERDTRC
jgi:hypothetical protein